MKQTFNSLDVALVTIKRTSFSLRNALSAASVQDTDNLPTVVGKLYDNVFNAAAGGTPDLNIFSTGFQYTTCGGLDFSVDVDETGYNVEIVHPRGWYRNSTLLASLWLEGFRPTSELDFEYDDTIAKAVDFVSRCPIRDDEYRAKLIEQIAFDLREQSARERQAFDAAFGDDYETLLGTAIAKLRNSKLFEEDEA